MINSDASAGATSSPFQRALSEGAPPHAVVDCPRRNLRGEVICKVFVRLLSAQEEDYALANAARYVRDLLESGRPIPWAREELEHNARCSEILAVACRHPDEPERPFFDMGVVDTRKFTADELGQLIFTYAALKEQTYPALKTADRAEVIAWVGIVAGGALPFPFACFSRTKLEAFADACAHIIASMPPPAPIDEPAAASPDTDSSDA